jgi:hypothetical protein
MKFLGSVAVLACLALAAAPRANAMSDYEAEIDGAASQVIYILKCDKNAFSPTARQMLLAYIDAHNAEVKAAGLRTATELERLSEKLGAEFVWGSWCKRLKPIVDGFSAAEKAR